MYTSQRKMLTQGKYLSLVNKNGWEYCERVIGTGVVAIIATTKDRNLILVEQFRPALNANVLELPAGLVGDTASQASENFLSAAKRELLEETGFESSQWKCVTEGPVSAGITNEIVTFFLATDCLKVAASGGDASEQITVHLVPLASLETFAAKAVSRKCLVDPKVFVGAYFGRNSTTLD
jgi:ADP-ribose pyrophosphatase